MPSSTILFAGTDLFPELASKKEISNSYPPLFPGCYALMFRMLEAEGVDPNRLDFSNPGECAAIIHTTLLRRVYSKAPDSRLLSEAPVASEMLMLPTLIKKTGEGKKTFRKRKGRFEEEWKFLSPSHLTLAFSAENFQTALVRAMETALIVDEKELEEPKGVVEALMYRLGMKEPRAFPEAFFGV